MIQLLKMIKISYVIMLHNIWNALKLVFIDSVVNDEFELRVNRRTIKNSKDKFSSDFNDAVRH